MSKIQKVMEVIFITDYTIKNRTLLQIVAALNSRQLTAEELVRFYLERIRQYNNRYNAVISLNPDAIALAHLSDQKRDSGGTIGKLEGIPFIVKDSIDVAGMPTSFGCVLFQDYYPVEDAEIIRKLRAEGAIIIGKANLTEFAIGGMGNSSLGGQTVNPFDLTRTAGGSSSGSAVSVACDFAAAAVGTDTVNSLRSPSSAVSVVGFRATWGLVDVRGCLPTKKPQDICGTIARTVADEAFLFDIIGEAQEETANYERIQEFNGMTFGLLTNFIDTREPEVSAVVQIAVTQIIAKGGKVIEFTMPEIDTAVLSRDFDLGELGVCDITNRHLMPTGQSLEKVISSGVVCPEVQERLSQAVEKRCSNEQERIACRLKLRDAFVERLLQKMDAQGISALLYPHQSSPVAKISGKQNGRNGILAAVTGFPAIVIPGGFTSPDENAPLGIPVGVELLTRPNCEKQLFSLADCLENILRARKIPIM